LAGGFDLGCNRHATPQDIPGPEYSALKLLIDVCHSSCLAIMHPLVQGISSSASCFPDEDDLN